MINVTLFTKEEAEAIIAVNQELMDKYFKEHEAEYMRSAKDQERINEFLKEYAIETYAIKAYDNEEYCTRYLLHYVYYNRIYEPTPDVLFDAGVITPLDYDIICTEGGELI